MNRNARRKAEAIERARIKSMPPARADKRPLYYDINVGDRVQCYYCALKGLTALYKTGEAVMNDPANPPVGIEKGEMHTVCTHHLPENAVIYNPRTNYCRNKTGDHTWEEQTRQEIPDTLH